MSTTIVYVLTRETPICILCMKQCSVMWQLNLISN